MRKILIGLLFILSVNVVSAVDVYNMDELNNALVDNCSYIFVHEGNYVISQLNIPEGKYIKGEGISTIFVQDDNCSGYGLGITDNTILEDVVYVGNNNTLATHGIRIDGNNVKINRVKVSHTVHHGITSVSGSDNVSIIDCTVSNTGCINTQDGAGIIVNGKNCIVTDNKVFNTAYHGIQAYTNSQNCIISNNHVVDCGNNLRSGGSKGAGIKSSTGCCLININGNNIVNQYGEGILLDDCDECIVDGNIITNATRGIYEKNSGKCLINDNLVLRSRDNGIYLYQSNTSYLPQ